MKRSTDSEDCLFLKWAAITVPLFLACTNWNSPQRTYPVQLQQQFSPSSNLLDSWCVVLHPSDLCYIDSLLRWRVRVGEWDRTCSRLRQGVWVPGDLRQCTISPRAVRYDDCLSTKCQLSTDISLGFLPGQEVKDNGVLNAGLRKSSLELSCTVHL